MEVQDQESLGRWDGLGSRDASSRTEAMENICQDVMRKVEAIGPLPAPVPSPPPMGYLPNSDLNDILAHLLMLSKRCPFEDVRAQCIRLLQAVQVRNSYYYLQRVETPGGSGPFVLCCNKLCNVVIACAPILVLMVLFRRHLLLSSPPHKRCRHYG